MTSIDSHARPADAIGAGPAPWWARPGLEPIDGRLTIAGRDAEALAWDRATPLYIYDLDRVARNARRMAAAFERAGLTVRRRFALKANREPEVLAVLRELGPAGQPDSVGIDACSPGEVIHALANGWAAEEISYTGTNVSERDLDVLLAHPIHLNLDAISQVERVGRRAPGRTIGLRVNPATGTGYTNRSHTAGSVRPSSGSLRIGSTMRSPPLDAIGSRSIRSTSTRDRAGWPMVWRVSSVPSRLRSR